MLFAPNRFVMDWVNEKYLRRIEEVLKDLNGGQAPRVKRGYIDSLFFECSVVGNAIEKGIEKVEPCLQRPRVLAEALNDKRSILWDEFYSFGQNDDQYYGNRQGADEAE